MDTTRSPIIRFSLVLGSGGTAGGAFHAGVLKALHDVWRLDPRDTQLIVGTSAGALSGSLLAAGVSADDLFRREVGKPLSAEAAERFDRARSRIGDRRPAATADLGRPAAPEVLAHALRRPFRVAPGALAAGFIPRGAASTAPVQAMIGDLLDHQWPRSPELKLVTVQLRTGRRTVFSSSSGVDIGLAVGASCSVPGVFRPVTIDGDEYVDGAVHSSDNVDVLRREPCQDLIIVSSPMGTQRVSDRPGFWTAYRSLTKAQTRAEISTVPGNPQIVLALPGPDVLDAMGPDMLDSNRRATVAMQSYAAASDLFRSTALPIVSNARKIT